MGHVHLTNQRSFIHQHNMYKNSDFMYTDLKFGNNHVTPFVISTTELSMTKPYAVFNTIIPINL